jgi:hypothetical protein
MDVREKITNREIKSRVYMEMKKTLKMKKSMIRKHEKNKRIRNINK